MCFAVIQNDAQKAKNESVHWANEMMVCNDTETEQLLGRVENKDEAKSAMTCIKEACKILDFT